MHYIDMLNVKPSSSDYIGKFISPRFPIARQRPNALALLDAHIEYN